MLIQSSNFQFLSIQSSIISLLVLPLDLTMLFCFFFFFLINSELKENMKNMKKKNKKIKKPYIKGNDAPSPESKQRNQRHKRWIRSHLSLFGPFQIDGFSIPTSPLTSTTISLFLLLLLLLLLRGSTGKARWKDG